MQIVMTRLTTTSTHTHTCTHTHFHTQIQKTICVTKLEDFVPLVTKIIHYNKEENSHIQANTHTRIPKTTLLFNILNNRLMHVTLKNTHSTLPVAPEYSSTTSLATSANKERGTNLESRSAWWLEATLHNHALPRPPTDLIHSHL